MAATRFFSVGTNSSYKPSVIRYIPVTDQEISGTILKIDGSRMQKGIIYEQSHDLVASWNSIRLLLTMTAVYSWHTKQLNYTAVLPSTPIEWDFYIQIPKGVSLKSKSSEAYVLRLHKYTYDQINARRVWNDYLVKTLLKIGFKQSQVDKCV